MPSNSLPLAASSGKDAGQRVSTCIPAADASAIAEACARLRAGGLVGMPTETVYGLAADATSDAAVAEIYAAKGRPTFNPLIAHVPDLAAARSLGRFDADATRLAEAFWPGPLTLVVPTTPDCAVGLLARAGLGTLALRVPSHPIAQALLRAYGKPLAAPSANRSGRVSPTTAQHVADDLAGRVDVILDAGACEYGIESTIVACLDGEPTILRAGAVTHEALAAALGRELRIGGETSSAPMAPGALASHYAPEAALRLNARALGPGEAALDFAGLLAGAGGHRLDLSPGGDVKEAAANLFAHLRALDAMFPQGIAVAPIPETGLGAAINDRLRRAAAPRPGV